MKNTCSIKFLPEAHVGVGMRMTKDKNTLPFDNKPMTHLVIEEYTKMGFYISHQTLPKKVWVDFDQLPLTRLTIVNGVIEDEITFVENIVNHRMQLIRTLDTEYIDLIYAEKELEKKVNEIIPISEAIPGHIYIGAQCEEGTPMIFLGVWHTKQVLRNEGNRHYYGYSRNRRDKFQLAKNSPKRAFFAVHSTDLTNEEDNEAKLLSRYDDEGGGYKERQKRWEEYGRLKAKKAEESRGKRFKILEFAITSKRIKQVIKQNDLNLDFVNKDLNRDVIICTANSKDGNYYGRSEEQSGLIELLDSYTRASYPGLLITNAYYSLSDINYLQDNKTDINKNAYHFVNTNFKLTLNPTLYCSIEGDIPLDFETK